MLDDPDCGAVELEHYRLAARSSGEGLWDWDLASGAVWYSPSLKALLGYGQADEFPDTFEGFYGRMHAEDRNSVLRAVRLHLEQQQPFDLICQMHIRSGELRWFKLHGVATRDRSGRPQRLAGLLRDITDWQRSETAARQAEELQRRALDALHVAVGVLDGRGDIVQINRSWRVFSSDRGLIGQHYDRGKNYARVCEESRERCSEGPAAARGIRSVLDGSCANFALTYCVSTPNCARHFELRAQPFVDGDSRGAFVIHMDVSATQEAHAALRQAQKMEAVGQLTGGIAHDFNNLLSVIVGNLQLLERPLHGQDRLLKQVQAALRAALRGSELTRRLLAFARRTTLEPRIVNVNELVQGMQELLGRSLGREIEVRSRLSAAPWPVQVDPGQLENCVLNLAINARDAMPAGGALTISTGNVTVDAQLQHRHPQLKLGDYLLLTVSDTGSGMPPEVAKRAFEPFFTTKEVGKGTGLGLPMVYAFLEQSRGLATLQSESGKGTTVGLYFPRVEGELAQSSAAHAVTASVPGGNESVLVVDDDADVRATAVVALRSLGYSVLEAQSASEALEILKRQPRVDLLFTDISLPGGVSGPVLADHARRLAPALKVLFTSGFSESLVLHRGILDGSLPLISKPYALAELAARMRTVLSNS